MFVDTGVGGCTCEDVDVSVRVDGTSPEEVDVYLVVVVVVVVRQIFNTTSLKKHPL